MKHLSLAVLLLATLALAACERAVVVAPTPVAVPGPAGPQGTPGNTGAQGTQGNTGAQGMSGDQGATGKPGEGTTVIVVPPAASAPAN